METPETPEISDSDYVPVEEQEAPTSADVINELKSEEAKSTSSSAEDSTKQGAAEDNAQASDDDDVDTSSTTSDDSGAGLSPSEDPMELVVKATTCKEDGNTHFKAGDLPKAVKSYRKGTNLLKPLNKNNTGDEQVKALLVTLQNNLSMVFLKQNKVKVSRDIATKSIKIDGSSVKAYYRRAMAHRKMGDLEKARDDLKEALKYDAGNTAVKKELASVKKDLASANKKLAKGFSAAFSAGSSSLYEDKEQEKQRRLEEQKLKKKLEEEEKEKRKKQWEDECVQRMAKGDPAISFEDWDKGRKADEDKRKKEEAAKKKAAKRAAAAAKKEDTDSDEELTEAELKALRGYKKTKDGRVTSYFTREQSEHEKAAIGDITPQLLGTTDAKTPALVTPVAEKKIQSAWNKAGTWEEKDTTKWCTEKLRERLLSAKFALQATSMERYSAVVTSVDSLTGDASVATTGGKKRYIFDYHATLKFEVRGADIDDNVAEGTLSIPDICSTHHEELEVNFSGWKKSPAGEHKEASTQCQQSLIIEIRQSVKKWVEDFNHHY